MMRNCSVVAIMLIAAIGKAEDAGSGNVNNGRSIYKKYGCYQCHGLEAQGSSATGPRIGPGPIPFAAFAGYVRKPTGQMPPYTNKVMSDSELADVYAFLRALPKAAAAKFAP